MPDHSLPRYDERDVRFWSVVQFLTGLSVLIAASLSAVYFGLRPDSPTTILRSSRRPLQELSSINPPAPQLVARPVEQLKSQLTRNDLPIAEAMRRLVETGAVLKTVANGAKPVAPSPPTDPRPTGGRAP